MKTAILVLMLTLKTFLIGLYLILVGMFLTLPLLILVELIYGIKMFFSGSSGEGVVSLPTFNPTVNDSGVHPDW